MLEGCTPWPKEFAELYRRKGYWQNATLWDMIVHSAKKWPDKVAFVADDARVTYAQLVERSANVAGHLWKLGFRPLDRVVFQIHNCAEFVYAFFALTRIGVIPVMALRAHRQAEISHFLKHAKAVGYFIPSALKDFDYRTMAEEMKAISPDLKYVVVAGEAGAGQVSLTSMIDTPAPLPDFQPDPGEVALMLLSGGTTALPKMIPRTNEDYVLNARLSSEVGGYNEDTVFLTMLPIAHNYSLASPGILGTFLNGGRVVLSPTPDADTVLKLVESERATVMAAAVPLVAMWVNSGAPSKYDLSSLKVIQSGGSRLLPEMRKKLAEQFRCFHQEIYGTAEGLLNMVRLDDTEEHRMESSGAPVCDDDEIKVIDDEGNEVPDGQPGELVVRGPYTIRGYYNAPETNEKAFTADGFYRMGDVVRKRGRYVYTEGRKKDLINRGGEKISVEEIEDLILRMPKVRSVTVVAMPDPIYGEKACAFIIPHPRQKLTLPELSEFLLGCGIAKFKLPERLEIVDEFPVSPAGKVLRRKLREMIEEKLATDAKK